VVGAGPAGLAFATVAAQRGHDVTLFEASPDIGGQFNMAKIIPGKEEFQETLRYYKKQIELTGVKIASELTSFSRRISERRIFRSGFGHWSNAKKIGHPRKQK